MQGCHVGVIALSDPEDVLLYTDPLVDYDLRYDLDTPSMAILEAVHFMHKAAYTHVVLQQVRRIPVRVSSNHDLDVKTQLGTPSLLPLRCNPCVESSEYWALV